LNSRQRFVLIFSGALMVPFVVFPFLGIYDFGTYVTSYAIVYFALRMVLNPRLRIKIDVLRLVLFAGVVFFVAQRVIAYL
jgi:hypothetical protein